MADTSELQESSDPPDSRFMSVVLPAPLGPAIAILLPMSMPMLMLFSPKSSRPGRHNHSKGSADRARVSMSHSRLMRVSLGTKDTHYLCSPMIKLQWPDQHCASASPINFQSRQTPQMQLPKADTDQMQHNAASPPHRPPLLLITNPAVPPSSRSPGYLKSASISCISGGGSSVGSGKWKATL